MNHLYSYLKEKGYDDASLDLFKGKIPELLKQKNIIITEIPKIDVAEKFFKDLYDFKNRGQYKADEILMLQTLHDASILKHIKSSRSEKWITDFDKAEYFFLTSSYSLDRFCFEHIGEKTDIIKDNILDILLTNILWLRQPDNNAGLSIHHLVSFHSKNLLVDNKFWLKFQKRAKELLEKNEITETDYVKIINNNQYTLRFLEENKEATDFDNSIFAIRDKILNDEHNYKIQIKNQKQIIDRSIEENKKINNRLEESKAKEEEYLRLLYLKEQEGLSKKYLTEIATYRSFINDLETNFNAKLEQYKKTFIHKIKAIFQDSQKIELLYRKTNLDTEIIKNYNGKIIVAEQSIATIEEELQSFRIKIIYCENKNAIRYNNLGLKDLYFIPVNNSNEVFNRALRSPEAYGLRDRDYLEDTEIEKLKNTYKNYRILEYYAFENYLYHPDNLEQINLKKFNRAKYIDALIELNKSVRANSTPKIVSSRKAYEEFKIEGNEFKGSDKKIYADIHSDDFSKFYKYLSMKDYQSQCKYLSDLKIELRDVEKILSSTNWFKEQIKKVIGDIVTA